MARTSYQYKNSIFQAFGLFPSQHLGPCHLTPEHKKTLRELGNISDDTEIWIPCNTSVMADHVSHNWVCIYEQVFRYGVKFPLYPLMIKVIQALKVLPCQIMRTIWRTSVAIDFLC